MTEPEDTDIQRLIRLKKYEQPPEGFVDDFLVNFHHRQRREILNNSATSLFWERLMTFMHGRVSPGMGLAGAVVAVLLVGGAVMWVPRGTTLSTVASAQAQPAAPQVQATVKNDNRNSFAVSPFFGVESEDRVVPHMRPAELANYLSEHFRGGFADEQFYKVNGLLDPEAGNRFSPVPLLDTPQNGSAKNIQRQ